ncbi:MAG: MotA/TolQ/ExbB proton channel family protein [Pseudomonadota bacterium]
MGILGLLAQVETAPITENNHTLVSLFLGANFVVQLTIILLVIFSVVSWAIIGSKHRQLKRDKARANDFYKHFWQSKTIEQFVTKAKFRSNPAYSVFRTGLDSLRENPDADSAITVEKEIRRATEDEIEQMEYGVPFLATTGSAAPFIGLFGTVWGILHAFWKIGRTGTSSLAVVGPHIAEALIATAIGLAAAIPAVIFYNVYTNKIRIISKDLENFSEDLISRLNKEYYKI